MKGAANTGANFSLSENHTPAWLNITSDPPVGEADHSSLSSYPSAMSTAVPTRAPRTDFPTSSPVSTPLTTEQQQFLESESYVASTDTEIVLGTLRLYGTFYLLCFFIFCLVRKYKPKWYNLRGWVKELQCDLAVQPDRYVGWIDWTWKVYQVTDEELLDQCGMDCLCFLRSLRLGCKLSAFGCLNAIWLLPLYVTAKETEETENLTDIFVIARYGKLVCWFVCVFVCSFVLLELLVVHASLPEKWERLLTEDPIRSLPGFFHLKCRQFTQR
jgi:Late exocytosis, associated with Golgi transport